MTVANSHSKSIWTRPRGTTMGSLLPTITDGDFRNRYGLSRVSPGLRSQIPGAVTFGPDALAVSYAAFARAMSTICASRSTRPTNVRPPCSKVPSLKATAAPPCARRPAEAITATAPATTSATNVRLTPMCSSFANGGPECPPYDSLDALLLRLQLRRRRLGEPRRLDRPVGLNIREFQRHLHVGLLHRPRERDLHAEARQLAIVGIVDLRRHERDRRNREPQQPHQQAAGRIEEST